MYQFNTKLDITLTVLYFLRRLARADLSPSYEKESIPWNRKSERLSDFEIQSNYSLT